MKIRPVGAELFHSDRNRRTDRHDEAHSRFSQFYERAYNTKQNILLFFHGKRSSIQKKHAVEFPLQQKAYLAQQ